jgi:KipI family sensor histidine kinase inhibitor
MKIETVSVDSVIIYFEEIISEEVLDKVQHTYRILKGLPGIIDLTPSYHSILIHYDLFEYDDTTIKRYLEKKIASAPMDDTKAMGKLIEIPVDYHQGLDLERIAQLHGLTKDEVITKHSSCTYRVYAIGFMVGFAYLAKVDASISTPRLETPRDKVPKGSVAIAESQTAIYPQQSAGGWNIIGHTDFDDYSSFEIGDRVRFIAI